MIVKIVKVIPEVREGLDEGAPARHNLDSSSGQEVEGRKALEDPDGVVGAQPVTALVSRILFMRSAAADTT